MRWALSILALSVVFVLGGAPAAGQPPTDPDFWMACWISDHQLCEERPVPTVTVTTTDTTTETTVSTVTVTAPTTTEPPPTTTTEPPPDDPPTQPNINVVGNWTCTGFQDRALVRVTVPDEPAFDGIDVTNWRNDCHGEIDRIEITAFTGHDLFDINAATIAPHDLTIGGGFVRARGSSPAAHQDCIQTTNGTAARNILIRNVVFSGCDTQYIISSPDGAGVFRAQNVVCDGCTFLPEHPGLVPAHTSVNGGPANAMIITGGNVGTLNSLVCIGSRFNHGVQTAGNPLAIGWMDAGTGTWDGVPAPGSGNILAPVGDHRCLGSG